MAKKKAVVEEVENDSGVMADIEEAVGSGKAVKFNLNAWLQATVDEVSRKQGVDADPMEDLIPMSTGFLMLDIMYGGGIRPAMYTHAGEEQTAKTTLALAEMVQAINVGVPLIAFWDYEGSTKNSKPYIRSILKTMGANISLAEIFGKKDKETGKWVVAPRIQYFPETIGEKFFDWLAEIERRMPDKRLIGGDWWLVYEDSKVNRAAIGDAHDPKMSKKYGKGLWVPAPDGNLQAMIIVDSWAAMNPESNDEENADNSLSVQARFFSKHLPRIKGRLAKKMIAVVGMNQLGDIPMAMYGPKQKESGGNKLRYNSDVRIWNTKRASGMYFAYENMFDKEDSTEKERSVTGKGKDSYRYIQSKTVKNKLSTPGRKGWFRIWVEDAEGNGCGFDPFYDTMVYLLETGQLSGNRKKLVLSIDGQPEISKPANWMQMKEWVLGTKEQKQKVCKELGIAKPFDLRKYLFKQVASGKGESLYVAAKDAKKATE